MPSKAPLMLRAPRGRVSKHARPRYSRFFHSRESGNSGRGRSLWTPTSAGVTSRRLRREEKEMTTLSRRSVLRSSLALTATGMLARPYLANAAATTATVWWTQGFAEEEDISFKKIVADYQKASGNTIDYSIMPYAPLRQKIVSAVTSGVVPDLFQNTPAEVIALHAWDDRLVDVSDVIETQKTQYTGTALLTVNCYNS